MTYKSCCLPNSNSSVKKNDQTGSAKKNDDMVSAVTGTQASISTAGPDAITSKVAMPNGDKVKLVEDPLSGENVKEEDEERAYEDLRDVARKREIKVTIRKGTQAGIAAGLSVMAGTIVAGPVGAVVGGSIGTAVAASISRDVVSLSDLLEQTPMKERHEVLRAFNESFKEEFMDAVVNNPELRLLMGGGTNIFGVVRYMLDRELIHSEQLERLDKILKRVT